MQRASARYRRNVFLTPLRQPEQQRDQRKRHQHQQRAMPARATLRQGNNHR